MKTGISYTSKQIHPNSNEKHLWIQGQHIQSKNKQNGSKAYNQFKGFIDWLILRFCCWPLNLVTQVAFTTVR